MFKYLIIWKENPIIWWTIKGVSYIDALKDELKRNIEYFGVSTEYYLEDQEIIKRGYVYNSSKNEDIEVFSPTPEQFEKCFNFHLCIFQDDIQYIVFQINFITGQIRQMELEELS